MNFRPRHISRCALAVWFALGLFTFNSMASAFDNVSPEVAEQTITTLENSLRPLNKVSEKGDLNPEECSPSKPIGPKYRIA